MIAMRNSSGETVLWGWTLGRLADKQQRKRLDLRFRRGEKKKNKTATERPLEDPAHGHGSSLERKIKQREKPRLTHDYQHCMVCKCVIRRQVGFPKLITYGRRNTE